MRPLLKKIALFALLLGVVAGLAFALKYYKDTAYQGDEAIHFLKGDYEDLDALLAAPELRDKLVYVDLWFSTCGFCRKEFGHLPKVREYLKDKKQVAFLYLSHETRHPNTRQLWKNAIQEFDLTGWHFMMDRDFEKRVWQALRAKDPSVRGGFPHYLIIDNASGFRDYNAPKPSELPEFKAVMEPLLRP